MAEIGAVQTYGGVNPYSQPVGKVDITESKSTHPAMAKSLNGRNFAFSKAAIAVSSVIDTSPVYWLSALQDGTTTVFWTSFTRDYESAPAGHTYSNLRVQASWFI
jgi:hypothetical protein